MLQRETDLDDLILDGQLTANVILDDIRSGDIIEYSYSVIGDNPIFKGLFSYTEEVIWSVPVHQQSLRVLWGKQTPLHITQLYTTQNFAQQKLGAYTEYLLTLADAPVLNINSEVPRWYDPYGTVIFTETADWSDVVQWALPIYQQALGANAEVKAIAQEIALKYPDPRQRVVQALRFVQSEIRYFGIELGTNSHQPSASAETLKRRYGDCKDKAVLFVSILDQLGIKSSPALVHTRKTRELKNYPAMVDVFNHVIVKVELDQKTYWLDPTRQFQYGDLSSIYQPNYQYALVIAEGSHELERMNKIPDKSWTIVHDQFDLSNGVESTVNFQTRTEYLGLSAEQQFSNLADYNSNSLQKDYVEFYQDYYGKLKPKEKISITEDRENGKVIILENYDLFKFWDKKTENKKYYASFYANSILHNIPKPDEENRNSPFSLRFPKNIKHTIQVQFPATGWFFENEKTIENNPFFNFSYTASYDKSKQLLTLDYQLNLLVDHIAEKDIESYLKAREKVRKEVKFKIQKAFPETVSPASEIDIYQWIEIIYAVLLISGLTFAIINWRIESRNTALLEEAVFYPVSLTKFIVLNIVTFGIYSSYWFYRNWFYIKNTASAESNESRLMPVARGIFNQFWYYPLYQKLFADSQARYQKNRVMLKPVAILFALFFFSIYFLNRIDNMLIPVLIIEPLLLIPLLNYINHIEDNKQRAYALNSHWRLRHTVLSIIFTPFLIYVYAATVNLIPDDAVVSGEKLWSHDIRFMQRQKLFPVNEKPLYFYSDAFLNLHNDGNGFTKSHVFSYWKDENNVFNTESATFSEVKNIEATYSNEYAGTSSVTITRNDDSEFVLYVGSSQHKDKIFINTLKTQWRIAK
jgi:hypothetical protein